MGDGFESNHSGAVWATILDQTFPPFYHLNIQNYGPFLGCFFAQGNKKKTSENDDWISLEGETNETKSVFGFRLWVQINIFK